MRWWKLDFPNSSGTSTSCKGVIGEKWWFFSRPLTWRGCEVGHRLSVTPLGYRPGWCHSLSHPLLQPVSWSWLYPTSSTLPLVKMTCHYSVSLSSLMEKSVSLSSLFFTAHCLILNPLLKIVFLLFSSLSLALLLFTNLHNSANLTGYKSLWSHLVLQEE